MRTQRESSEESRSQTLRLRAFGDAEVQSQLQLTDNQREQIYAILRAGFQEAKPIRESLAEVQKRTLEKATAVLTGEQKLEWERMSQDGSGMGGGPPMRSPRRRGPGMRGGPDRRGQPMGEPGMGGAAGDLDSM
jgi:hypothetical protein